MIPKLLHQIWLGPRPAPTVWTETWREANLDFDYRLWDEDAVGELGLRNDDVYRRYMAEGLYDGAADVARIEILIRFGGVYADADSVALRPLADAPFMEQGFFAPLEPNVDHPGLVTNAFMGAVPGHGVLTRYVDIVSQVRDLRPMWRLTGPGALTGVLTDTAYPDVVILPAWTFFAKGLSGQTVPGGSPYAQHFWSTTAERWGRGSVTPYPPGDYRPE
ncbi:MAG: glycosyltransferase family 32 protein [Actinomycetota bacterium]